MRRERPMIITKLSNIGVRKVSVENYHAAILTLDGRAYIWGRNDYNQVTTETNMDQSSPKLYNTSKDERIKDIICGEYYTALLTSNQELIYFGKDVEKCVELTINERSFNSTAIVPFNNLLSSAQYTLFNRGGRTVIFLCEEQKFLEEMLVVQSAIIKPLQKKNINTPNTSLYDDLCKTYTDLVYFWAANIQSMLECANNRIPMDDIIILKCIQEFIIVYKTYINTIYNVISIDGFRNISKLIDINQSLYKLRPESFTKKEKNNEEQIISTFLLAPVEKLDFYTRFIETYIKEPDLNIWTNFTDAVTDTKRQAEITHDFWLNSGKSIDFLKSPDRRLLRDSHKFPIYLHNASRFSSHWFILFSDLFVHMNGSTSHLHNLTTIWIEPQQDEASLQYQICLKMPEEVLILYTNEAEDKIDWFHELQNSIKTALNKSEALQPPVVRNSTYSFLKSGFLKDATYTGRWLNGKMHGLGKLQWSDGKTYAGQFMSNQLSGFGVMEITNVGRLSKFLFK